jgi:hypothetical protein
MAARRRVDAASPNSSASAWKIGALRMVAAPIIEVAVNGTRNSQCPATMKISVSDTAGMLLASVALPGVPQAVALTPPGC